MHHGMVASRFRTFCVFTNNLSGTHNQNNIQKFEDNRGCEKWTRTLSEPNRTMMRTFLPAWTKGPVVAQAPWENPPFGFVERGRSYL